MNFKIKMVLVILMDVNQCYFHLHLKILNIENENNNELELEKKNINCALCNGYEYPTPAPPDPPLITFTDSCADSCKQFDFVYLVGVNDNGIGFVYGELSPPTQEREQIRDIMKKKKREEVWIGIWYSVSNTPHPTSEKERKEVAAAAVEKNIILCGNYTI